MIHDSLITNTNSSRFSGNSEALASELLENLEDMFSRSNLHKEITFFKSSNVQWIVAGHERVS